ncbi:MAG TPA: sialidase family protein [Candidatus Dormibacteraeota bacterium]
MRKIRFVSLVIPAVLVGAFSITPASAASSGVGNVPQGLQSDAAYAASAAANGVTNVFATSQRTSCYRPEDPYFGNLGPANGYTGMTACTGATTGEDIGATPYPSQVGSNPGFPAATPMVVKDHSESDLRVDPTNPLHLIGSSKWAVSAEGYNHELGFYESFDGGVTWPNQGHIPGYEGWTDNTDPVGAFDTFGNYYSLILPYEFFYTASGGHSFKTNQNIEPNPSVPAEAITVAIRKHGATAADDWSTNRGAPMDIVAPYPAKGREPDKQWITIDTNPRSPHLNRIYAMWTVFDSITAKPFVSYADARADGTHTAWSSPTLLPTAGNNPQGDTYLLPHVDGNGTVYTTLTNFTSKSTLTGILMDRSTDGGVSWDSLPRVVGHVSAPPLIYANTTFRDGIEDTFAVGTHRLANRQYPLYVSWEDYSLGFGNLILSASFDGGQTWSAPIQVNDNTSQVDAFQPNLTTAADGTVVLAFYDRRLPCPAATDPDAAGAGLSIDNNKPFGAANYCVNASVQLYDPNLKPLGHNIRISLHTWDPELNSLKPAGIGAAEGFIGDYYGNITSGRTDFTTSVSTFNDSSNSNSGHFQQQVVATLSIP